MDFNTWGKSPERIWFKHSRNTPAGHGCYGVQSKFHIFDLSDLTKNVFPTAAKVARLMYLNWEGRESLS